MPDDPRTGASPPAVSVLMPCCNAAATLPEALDSLSRQTLPNFEIVAVDDGSTDATRHILQSWAGRDPRLRLVYQPHAGIVAALNRGLSSCRADLVARMDTDDRLHPQRLALQVDYLTAHPETAVVGSLVSGFPPGQVRQGLRLYLDWQNSLVTPEQIRREMFVESPLAHPSVTFRRSAVEAVGGYQDRDWPEDYDLWLRLYLAGAGFAKVPQVLLEWREHPARLTRTDSRYSLQNFLRLKAHYLPLGPLLGRDAVFVWGAGMMGRRLAQLLLRQGLPLVAFIDIDPRKIGRTRHDRPILPPEDLPARLKACANPVVLVAVGARGARRILRHRLAPLGLVEGQDWWFTA